MSRLIVKNLPSGLKEERLKTLFGGQGTITDCSMKYTKDGVFRKFAFIGYQTEAEGQAAIKHLHNSFIDTAKIQVEVARNFSDVNKPRAWSKYSKDSSAFQAKIKKLQNEKEKREGSEKDGKMDKKTKKKKAKEKMVDEMLGELKDDPGFKEFLEVHKNRTTKSTWKNDTVNTEEDTLPSNKERASELYEENDSSATSSDEEMAEPKPSGKDEAIPDEPQKKATQSGLSDLDYLKSKMTKSKMLDDSSSDEDDDSENEESKIKSESSSETEETKAKDEVQDEIKSQVKAKHVIKMKGLPPSVKEKQIIEFFKPLEIESVKIPINAKGKKSFSVATVVFTSDKDVDQALRKNKNFIGPKRIFLQKVKKEVSDEKIPELKPWELKLQQGQEEDAEDDETIAESGRLYVRNLSYMCKEEDLEEMFKTYGPLTKVHLPVDKLTKKVMGFAFITFMIPEHAVKAYSELDGSVFQGRMLHILPAKPKKEVEITDNMTYKQKKDAKQKATSGSSHNWNTLFLGANAVADVMAEKYGASKSDILSAESQQSLGVRMALGETQIVSETRDFLVENGVKLDAFSQAAAQRSKTVILVKNLPAGTKVEELRQIFEKFGSIGRIVLPPSGITAIIEYTEPSEARMGFRSLAYTKFQHVPLYLEWAPMDVFGQSASENEQKEADTETSDTMEAEKDLKQKQAESSEESEEEEAEPESTIFVKNLNFDTNEDNIREKFKKCGKIKAVTIAKKKDMKTPGKFLSMGYGFVEFMQRESAKKALKELQHTDLDGHSLELKLSNRATVQKNVPVKKKKADKTKKKSSKILVRNVPFEAKENEVKELFRVFGELKSVRLPKKLSGTGSHRGFGFVDFLTKDDAKRAFEALCHSTHLYGRRLVLEWADSEESVEQIRKRTAEHFHEDSSSKRLKKSKLLDELKGTSSHDYD